MQPLHSENWYISRAYGQERLRPSHVCLIEIIILTQLLMFQVIFLFILSISFHTDQVIQSILIHTK